MKVLKVALESNESKTKTAVQYNLARLTKWTPFLLLVLTASLTYAVVNTGSGSRKVLDDISTFIKSVSKVTVDAIIFVACMLGIKISQKSEK